MSAANISFSDAIRATAKAMQRSASDDAVSRLDSVAKALGRIDADAQTVIFDLVDGATEGVSDWLRREVGKLPKADSLSTQSAPGGGRGSVFAAIRAGLEAEAERAADDAAAPPNPWSLGSINRTRQAIITNRRPELAKRLKKEAEV